jgi:hypothetical protein
MFRLLIALLIIAFAVSSDAETEKRECDWKGVEIDSQGCVSFGYYRKAMDLNCSNVPDCFKFQIQEVPFKEEEPPKKKEFFSKEDPQEKQKIMPILDSSALALLKNSKLKDIKIIFYNKDGKLSKGFMKEAEKYLLEKGVKKDQFKIEVRE